MVLAKNQYQGITIGLTLPAAMVKLAASVPVALKRVEIYVKTHPPVSPFIKGESHTPSASRTPLLIEGIKAATDKQLQAAKSGRFPSPF